MPRRRAAADSRSRPTDGLSSPGPRGGRRSTKRDRIRNIFLKQEGHVSADELVELVRREASGIGRATVYRTLQWLVEAGIARKVDFGDGRSRYEASYRHPHHFHFICASCHRSSEFLSSDIEALMEEIAAARGFGASESIVQIRGVCEECRTGRKTAPIDGTRAAQLFARDALRMAIATERGGLDFYTRATSQTRDPRARSVFKKLAAEEREHLSTLEKRYQRLIARDPQLEAQPTFLFFKGAASGLFAAGAEELAQVETDEQALAIGIRCERGSHEFFKKYGERFEDTEGKQIFLEFADEEKTHLDLLIGEHRLLRERHKAGKP